MKEVYNISIVVSFLGLWITSIIPSTYEVILGFILIFSFGILHGSNDILLIENISDRKLKHPFVKVLSIYLLTVFLAVVIFYVLPVLALILFIAFSAFHFGEQHWEAILNNLNVIYKQLYFFIYGLFVLSLLFVFNKSEVINVITSITSYKIEQNIIVYCFIGSSISLLVLSVIMYFKSKIFKVKILTELAYLIVFTIIFKVSTLIWGFAIYFILWHSIPSLYEQINFIYGNFNKQSVILYLKKALPYWLVSLIGLAVVFMLFKEEKLLYAIVFSFIAAVTFPHSLVINKMFKYKKTQTN